MSTTQFVEWMHRIYDPSTKEEERTALIETFVETYQSKSFNVLFYVIRNSRNIHSPEVIRTCLNAIDRHQETWFRLDVYRLATIGCPREVRPLKLDVQQSGNVLYTLHIQSWMWIFEEINTSFTRRLNFDNVRFIDSDSGYDLTSILRSKAEKLGYI